MKDEVARFATAVEGAKAKAEETERKYKDATRNAVTGIQTAREVATKFSERWVHVSPLCRFIPCARRGLTSRRLVSFAAAWSRFGRSWAGIHKRLPAELG